MFKKVTLFALFLLMLAPAVYADRLDDAVRASSFDDVDYLLALKGNSVSQRRKDELVLLANEMTLIRKRGRYPFGTLWDSYVTGKGIIAGAITYTCVRKILATELPNPDGNTINFVGNVLIYNFYGSIGLLGAGYGLYWLINGLRAAHGRDLYNQAVEIEQRINNLIAV